MKILAFSDWRVQPINDVLNFVQDLEDVPFRMPNRLVIAPIEKARPSETFLEIDRSIQQLNQNIIGFVIDNDGPHQGNV